MLEYISENTRPKSVSQIEFHDCCNQFEQHKSIILNCVSRWLKLNIYPKTSLYLLHYMCSWINKSVCFSPNNNSWGSHTDTCLQAESNINPRIHHCLQCKDGDDLKNKTRILIKLSRFSKLNYVNKSS